MRPPRHSTHGTALVLALVLVAILSLVAGNVLLSTIPRLQTMSQSSGWHEALNAAETGIDLGLGDLCRNSGDLLHADWKATGWRGCVARATEAEGVLGPEASGAMLKPAHPSTTSSLVMSDTLARDNIWITTESKRRTIVDVQLTALWPNPGEDYEYPDAPVWFRIRSFGTAELPGLPSVGMSDTDQILRRLNLVQVRPSLKGDDNLRQNVSLPNVSRIVEVLARPIPRFPGAMLTRRGLSLPRSGNWAINSYYTDSAGNIVARPPFTGRANVGSVGKPRGVPLVDASSAIGGTNTEGYPRVNGDILLNASQEEAATHLPPAGDPWWDHYSAREDCDRRLVPASRPQEGMEEAVLPKNGSGNDPVVFQAGTPDHPRIYVYKGTLNTFVVSAPSAGSPGSVVIIVEENLEVPPGSAIVNPIQIDDNVSTRVYVQGSTINLANGNINATGEADPMNLRIYGIGENERDPDSGGLPREIIMNGNSNLNAVIYAPYYDVRSNGSGNGIWKGAVVSNSLDFAGGGASQFLFPEKLLSDIETDGFQVVRYFEDYRQ